MLALNSDEQVYGWGCNGLGQLATGSLGNEYLDGLTLNMSPISLTRNPLLNELIVRSLNSLLIF